MPKFDETLYDAIHGAQMKLIKAGEKVTVPAVKKELGITGNDSTISYYLRRLKAENHAKLNTTALSLMCLR